MTTAQLEEVGPAEYVAAWQKSLADPGNVSDRELAIIGFWDRSRGDRARSAREQALRPTSEPITTRSNTKHASSLPSIREGEDIYDYCTRAGDLPATMGVLGAMFRGLFDPLVAFVKQMNEQNKTRNARIEALEKRVAELEARPVVKDAGVWRAGTVYDAGAIVSHDGSAWICRATHSAGGDQPSPDCFRMFVKRGRDARR